MTRLRSVLARLAGFQSFEKTADGRHLSPLDSVRRLLDDLGRPEARYEIVHVAGTHGKGLTAAMIAATLERDGHRTGLYTSPAVIDVRDGIRIDGRWITADEFVRVAEIVLGVAEGYGGRPPLSWFDLMTAIAFLAFAEAGVDWVVVETGLGGRLDSTNVTDKALAVITPIDYDHADVLGGTLEAIAAHKLGILRDGVPVVVAPQRPASRRVLEKLLAAEGDRVVWSEELLVRAPGSVPAVYQENAGTALAARRLLDAPGEPDSWLGAALSVSLPGRLDLRHDVLWGGCDTALPQVVLDGCHTPAAIAACVGQLRAWRIEDYTLILGMAGDKLTDVLRRPLGELCRPAREIVLTEFESPRSVGPGRLEVFLEPVDPPLCTSSVGEAMKRVCESPRRPLVVAGSLYLAGEVLRGLSPADC